MLFPNAFRLQPSIQHPILDVAYHRGNKRQCDHRDDDRPANPIQRRIGRLEELTTNNTGCIGRHDEDRQSDRPLTRRPGIQGHPRSVDGMPDAAERNRHGQDGKSGVRIVGVDQKPAAQSECPPKEEPESYHQTTLAPFVCDDSPRHIENELNPLTD